MTIFELGALGEFLGSVAVLVTLIYLAVQIRHTKLSIQSSSWQTGIRSILDSNAMLASDPELLEIFQRGMADPDSLDSMQQLRFSIVLSSLIHVFHCWYLDHRKGLVDEEAWKGEEISMIAILSMPGGNRWWNQFGTPYTPGFRAYVDERLEESGDAEKDRYDWSSALS